MSGLATMQVFAKGCRDRMENDNAGRTCPAAVPFVASSKLYRIHHAMVKNCLR
jgi:hypothetical protein